MMIAASNSSSDIFTILESFVSHGDESPVQGRKLLDSRLHNMWKMGYAEGVTITVWVILNRMCKPGHQPYTPELIYSDVIMPLLQDGNISAAESKVEEMIGATWTTA